MDARVGRGFTVFEIIHVAFEDGVFCEQLYGAKGDAAVGEDIHAAVVIALGDIYDFGGAADARDAVGEREKHAKFRVVFEAVFYHLAVTGLENVQGKFSAGEKNDVQRKQRNAIRPHGSQVKSYQSAGQVDCLGI